MPDTMHCHHCGKGVAWNKGLGWDSAFDSRNLFTGTRWTCPRCTEEWLRPGLAK
jgi:NAD-dependent SIR2 family protein deacetylase